MLTYRQKNILSQVLPFGLIPAIFSIIQYLLEKGILGQHPVYPSTGNPYDSNILIPFLTSFIIGVLIGHFEVFIVNKWFQNRSFYQKIFFKFVIYMLAIIIATVIIIASTHAIGQRLSIFDNRVFSYLSSFFESFAFWSILCYYALAIVISLFYKEVSDNMGRGASLNFFTGKYHQPKVENRIFMFLDMKSSTAHAEALGHIKYFQMLKQYYTDLTPPIVNFAGEIYQYVGDEIIITWEFESNHAKQALECFFAMKEALANRYQAYLSNYSVAPTFKAAIHYGQVTTGEIGLIKKEFVFTGDTLNTTARIQSLCNQHQVDLIVSEKLLNAVESKALFNTRPLGEVELRGRNERIKLFNVTKNSATKRSENS